MLRAGPASRNWDGVSRSPPGTSSGPGKRLSKKIPADWKGCTRQPAEGRFVLLIPATLPRMEARTPEQRPRVALESAVPKVEGRLQGSEDRNGKRELTRCQADTRDARRRTVRRALKVRG